jgi:hypothetical protein
VREVGEDGGVGGDDDVGDLLGTLSTLSSVGTPLPVRIVKMTPSACR